MVTNQTLLAAQRLKKKRVTIFTAGLLLGLAAIILCLVMRWQAPMYAFAVLWVIGCVALGALWVSPAVWYARFQQDISKGRARTVTAVFEGAAPQPSVRSHLDVLEMRFTDRQEGVHPKDVQQRVVYWDMQSPPPQLDIGQTVQLTTYEYWIVDLAPVRGDQA